MATAAEDLKVLAERISRETNVQPGDVEKVLKAGYQSTMELVIERIKAEMTRTSGAVDTGTIDQLKESPAVRDAEAPVVK